MKKFLSYLFIVALALAFGCNEPVALQLERLDAANEKIDLLHQSLEEVKAQEDPAALMLEDIYLLEYEYPIREDESFVLTYRFNGGGCYEIKLDIYLNKESEAQKMKSKIIRDLVNYQQFGSPVTKNDITTWNATDRSMVVTLNANNIERGILNLNIKAND
jgi:hypothetical protein